MTKGIRCLLILGLGAHLLGFQLTTRPGASGLPEAEQERTVELQLAELSSLVSHASGIEQKFDYKVSEEDRFITIANQDIANYIHVFGLNKWRQLVYEMRELRNVEYLIDYHPSSIPATVIPNPIKDPKRYALVALRTAWWFPPDEKSRDLIYLAGVADQALTPAGHWNLNESGRPAEGGTPDTGAELNYVGLTYLILDRQSLDRLSTSHEPELRTMACLYVVERSGAVYISYYGGYTIPRRVGCDELRAYLTRRASRAELTQRLYRGRLVRHDWTSTYRSRLHGLNRLFGDKRQIELVLLNQAIVLENGRYRVMDQGWVAFTSDAYTLVSFGNFGAVAPGQPDNLLVTEVIGPVPFGRSQ